MGFSNNMRNCCRDNLIYKAVCFIIEDHFVINDRKREQLLDFFFFWIDEDYLELPMYESVEEF